LAIKTGRNKVVERIASLQNECQTCHDHKSGECFIKKFRSAFCASIAITALPQKPTEQQSQIFAISNQDCPWPVTETDQSNRDWELL
jgi:hypothetical protein